MSDEAYRRGAARAARAWDPALEDAARPTLEVSVTWGDVPLSVVHCTPPRTLLLSRDCGLSLAPSVFGEATAPIVRVVRGEVRLVISDRLDGLLDLDEAELTFEDARASGRLRASADAGCSEVRLPLGRGATIELGELRIEIAHVAAGRRIGAGNEKARALWWSGVAVSVLLHLAIVLSLDWQLREATRAAGDQDEKSIDRETQSYLTALAEKAGRGEGGDIVPDFGPRDSCVRMNPAVASFDGSLARQHQWAQSVPGGALRALAMLFADNEFYFRDLPLPIRQRMQLLAHGESPSHWGEPPPLARVVGSLIPAASDAGYGFDFRRRSRFAASVVTEEMTNTPAEIRRILRINALALEGCAFSALEAGAAPFDRTIDLAIDDDGEIVASQIDGDDEALASCVHDALAPITFSPPGKPVKTRLTLHGGLAEKGGKALRPPRLSNSFSTSMGWGLDE